MIRNILTILFYNELDIDMWLESENTKDISHSIGRSRP